MSRRSRAWRLPASQERTHSRPPGSPRGPPAWSPEPWWPGGRSPTPDPWAPQCRPPQEAPPAEGRGGLSVPGSPPWSPSQPEPVPLQTSLSAWPPGAVCVLGALGAPRKAGQPPLHGVGSAACDLELLVADELGEPAGRLPRPQPRAASPAADPVPAGLGHGPHERLGAGRPGRHRRLQVR